MLETDAILERAADLKTQGKPFALVTVVRCESPTSAKPGAKAIVDAQGSIQGWIGGGCAQPAVIATVKKALKDGQARLIRVSPSRGAPLEEGIVDFGMTCHSGGTLDIFIDPIVPKPALLIIGAAPTAQALSVLAHRTGFAVTAMFPGADAAMYPDAVQIVDGLDVSALHGDGPDFVVVATQGKKDEQGLEAALSTGSDYIAFIASERKAEKVKQYLRERGQEPGRVDAILAPAGIEIGAITPEEIALSALAGLVKARREQADGDVPATESATSGMTSCCANPEMDADAGGNTATDPVCGMSVKIAGAEYRFSWQGKDFYFCCAGCQQSFENSPQHYLHAGETAV